MAGQAQLAALTVRRLARTLGPAALPRKVVTVSKRKRMIVLTVALAALAAVMAGWKWGGSAQANAGIECSPYCNVRHDPLPPSGPCFYHGGVAWIVPGFTELGEYVLYYGCADGTVIKVGD